MTGYLNSNYAAAFNEFGEPLFLPACGAWILKRQIFNLSAYDGMGCYPLFCCTDWSKLLLDFEKIGTKLVSLAVVIDPFGDYDESYLFQCFPDQVILFKKHFIIDLQQPINEFVSSHHRRNVRYALDNVNVELCNEPLIFLDEWFRLYQNLIQKHNISGIQAFSKASFELQLKTQGISVFRAYVNEDTLGMLLWYQHNGVGYYHLGAFTAMGYELKASFALFWYAISHFTSVGLKWLDLGGGAGVQFNGNNGLSRFKIGWSTATKNVYFCGRIFDHKRYTEITQSRKILVDDYFPAYRKGEFS